MTKEREVLKLALEALKSVCANYCPDTPEDAEKAITAIKEALAQPEQEKYCSVCQGRGQVDTGIMESPVTICNACNGTGLKAQRTWVGLTDEEVIFLIENDGIGRGELIESVEAKLKEKNT